MLFVVGDSHSLVWKANHDSATNLRPKFTDVSIQHLGPALAWNLRDAEGSGNGKWADAVFDLLTEAQASGTPVTGVILSFGEIDIRTRLVSDAVSAGLPLTEAVTPIVQRLVDFAADLSRAFPFPVLIADPVPSTFDRPQDRITSMTPMGSQIERNIATEAFAAQTAERCAHLRDKEGLRLFSFGIFDEATLLYETRSELYVDSVHLGLAGFMLLLDSLRNLCRDHDLPQLIAPFDNVSLVEDKAQLVDMASRCRVFPSTKVGAHQFTRPRGDSTVALLTEEEDAPEVLVKLFHVASLDRLVLTAPEGEVLEEPEGLLVRSGVDQRKMNAAPGPEDISVPGLSVFSWNLSESPPARLIEISRPNGGCIKLGRLAVVGWSFDRRYPLWTPQSATLSPEVQD